MELRALYDWVTEGEEAAPGALDPGLVREQLGRGRPLIELLEAEADPATSLRRAHLVQRASERLPLQLEPGWAEGPGWRYTLAWASWLPELRGTALAHRDLIRELWHEARCPVCGGLAAWAVLRERKWHRDRSLLCARCGAEWPYPRFRCAACGHEEPDSLGVLEVEGVEGYRLDVCHRCRTYTKVRLVAGDQPVDGVLEDLMTLHLDALAEREGFHRQGVGLLPWEPAGGSDLPQAEPSKGGI
ncbi:MAG: formate dehydrogenase accessory protein FdhE [Bacillota bacterium]|nr:formate dehydrogenase accessory protein FdhE [Bacillota bacterium]